VSIVVGANNSHGDAKRYRKRISVLDLLKPGEAETILRHLLAAHPEFGVEAEQIARSVLNDVSFGSVADDVEDRARLWALTTSTAARGRHWTA